MQAGAAGVEFLGADEIVDDESGARVEQDRGALGVRGADRGEVEAGGRDDREVVRSRRRGADADGGLGRRRADEAEFVAAVHLAVDVNGVSALAAIGENGVAAVEAEVLAPGNAQRFVESVNIAGQALAAMQAAAPAPDIDIASLVVGAVDGFLQAGSAGIGGQGTEVAAVCRALQCNLDLGSGGGHARIRVARPRRAGGRRPGA